MIYMSDNDLLFLLALQNTPKIGDITAKRLIAHCGTPEGVFFESKKNLLKIDGIGSYTISELNKNKLLKLAEKELKFISDNNIITLYFQDIDYPERLKHCVDGPILLFQRGCVSINNQPIISIIGARKNTPQGMANCETIVKTLAPFNPIIVSGFAYGTDITAQRAALNYELQTIGCLAHGMDKIYPREHKKYVVDIENHGGFFTDFWSSSKFDRKNFLKRNRIIAGLSEATIVIESAEKGGSLVTADIANSYNREVFAVPGRITDKQSTGCNNLIKYQKAHLLSKPEDIPYILNWKLETLVERPQKQLFIDMDIDETLIYNFLESNGKELLDIIALKCEIPVFRVASILIQMELKGAVRPLPGKYFEII